MQTPSLLFPPTMKILSLTLLALLALTPAAFCFSGPGPWADGAYYPGGLDGKYFGIVTGNNISGVVGFAITEGAPPSRENQNQRASEGNNPIVIINPTFGPDPLQNYFSVFVEGRVYSGVTYAGIDIDAKKIAGTLNGLTPGALPQFTAEGGANAIVNSLPIVNRGLSGGFTADVKKRKQVFTFRGNGQLSTPANPQTVSLTSVPILANPILPPLEPDGTITNQVSTGLVTTHSTPFQVSGIRTSFNSSNPAARQDELRLTSGGGVGGAGGGN